MTDQSAHFRKRHQTAVSRHERAKRVTGADRADRAWRAAYEFSQFVFVRDRETTRRDTTLAARPVMPADDAAGSRGAQQTG